MPVNRNALIRYRTIDKCLQNRYRKWTLDDLIDACSDALYEYEGIDKGISRRSVQMDIQMMRSEKLGYSAPIVVLDKKYYTYEDPDYSISNIPLTDQDLNMLNGVVDILKQFKGFSHFTGVSEMVSKLEDQIYTSKLHTATVIDFEKNENLRGIEHLDALYHAIIDRQPLTITYQSFKARQAGDIIFHPYLLKQYRNRWFLLGMPDARKQVLNLALDRMLQIDKAGIPYIENELFDSQTYFKHLIGVTDSRSEVLDVHLFIEPEHAPYVITKPVHPTQEIVEQTSEGLIISIKVKHNFELEREILGFGNNVKVLKPRHLVSSIKKRLALALGQYQAV